MGRQRSCTNLWRRFPPDPARSRQNGRGIWLYKRSFRHRILRFLLLQRRRLRLHWPRSLLAVDTPRSWTQRPRSARLIRLSTRPSIAAVPVPFAAAIRRLSRKSLKEQIGVIMPRRYCGSCRSPLHADDGHSECVSCLGKSHADAALAGSDCSHCESISLASLRSRIAFFSESDPAPRALPFSSSQGPVRKKQRGRGSQRPVESELTPAQILRASLSPHFRFRSLLALPAWNSGLTTPRSSWNQGMVTYLRYFQPRSELRSSRSPRFLRLRRTGSYPCYALSELWESTLSVPPPLGVRNSSLLASVTAPKGIRSRSRDSLSG